MTKPNLFIVGQPKSGTSALYTMLQDHPEICMCEEKEPSIFARDFMEQSIAFHGRNIFCHCTAIEEYLKLFPVKDEKIVGEGSTHYLYSQAAAQAIHEFNPAARIIMMLREPITFMHSLHAENLAEAREDVVDFARAVALEESRLRGENIPPLARCPAYHIYKARALDYRRQIERFVAVFPKEQIRLIIFEDFRGKNEEYLREIFRFLGVDENYTPQVREINKNKTVRFRGLYHLIQSPDLKKGMRTLLGTKLYFSIKKGVDKVFFRTEKRAPIPPDLQAALKTEFTPMVRDLNTYLHEQGLTDIDLVKIWGYDV
ncbi:MAG: sulfotransferase [Candidatus Omnitrophica bacterium]|nr:sulfotransferase [Candidatus Omnitrophota bacterium]MCB9721748.1 sulfotransferase [Candidatus Omnitrophota bacterium]